MPRSGVEARDRLERAALELYSQRSYDQTTIADIAVKAGVTQRTFFRHFTDKREVLFNGGLAHWNATLLAQVGTTAWGHAIHTWVADSSSQVDTLIAQAFAVLQDFATANTTAPPATPL